MGGTNGQARETLDLATLVTRATDGERAALNRLLFHFHPRLVALVQRRLPADIQTTFSPEDVIQETMMEAFRSIGTFEAGGKASPEEAFFRWLCTIARNRLVDILRAQRAQKRKPAHGGRVTGSSLVGANSHSLDQLIEMLARHSHTPSRAARANELEAAVRAALATIHESYREVLELRYLMGLPSKQVAERLGITEPAVRKRCSRAIHALTEAVGDLSNYTSRV